MVDTRRNGILTDFHFRTVDTANMNGFRLSLLFTLMLITPSMHCPDKCVCVNKTDSDIVIDCTKLGIVIFPPDITWNDFELQEAEFAVIDLSQNDIIQADFPSKYKSVGRINLAYNEIATMKNVTVSDVESLKELDLSHNKRLEKLTIELKSKSLEILTMRNCSIREVEEGFLESFPSLKLMDISQNSLMEMGHPVSFGPKDLRSGEDFTLNESERKHFQLTHLNISHNRLIRIHGHDFRFTKIKILDISNNRISHLKFTMYLPHAQELYVSQNHLKNLDGLSASNLIHLDVSRNRLNNIHFDFHAKTPKLKILHIQHNHIEKLTIIKSSTILDLDVSFSHVRIIEPEAFSRLEHLERLNLMGNELTHLHHEVFLYANNLQFLLLGENPWNCDCASLEFRALYDFVIIEKKYSNGEDLQCLSDSNKSWSTACLDVTHNDDLVLSERGAFYTMLYLFVALLTLIALFSCFKCVRNMRQSDAMTFDNNGAAVSDVDFGVETPLDVDRTAINAACAQARPPSFPTRRSTPPPNYEAALMLPVLTEEQRELAISTLSLNRAAQ